MEHVACNLCGECNEMGLYNHPTCSVVMCKNCSLVYLNPRMKESEYRDHYEKQYQIARHNIHDYKTAIDRLERKNSYEQKKKHLNFLGEFISPTTRVFEVGVGWGTLLKVIKDTYDAPVSGIEISALATEVARRYYNLKVLDESLEEYISKGRTDVFDLVIMHHVLEHFLNPKDILQKVQRLLSSKGVLYIAVPNMANPDEPLSKFFRIEHPYYFSPTTLMHLFASTGLKVLKSKIGPTDMRFIVGPDHSENRTVVAPVTQYFKLVRIRCMVFYRRMLESIKEMLKAVLR